MNIISAGILVLFCLSSLGLACRGIALLSMRQVKPGRVISVTGVIAMVSLWVFAGVTPIVCSAFAEIYREFDVALPPVTELTISLFNLPFRYGLLWYPFAFGLSLCALTMPEILFRRPHPE